MDNINELWERILRLIREDMKEGPFQSFILPLQPVSLQQDNRILVLQAENEFSKNRIEERKFYSDLLRDCIRDILGPEYNYTLVLEEDLRPKQEERPTANPSQYTGDPINPKYTFQNFVMGKSNQFAQAGAYSVAKAPSSSFNPLFIYGGAGLGKTHLVCAIANDILTNRPELNVMYVTSETFVNDYISALRNNQQNSSGNTINEFREKYRNVDVLIVDDVQFLAGKDSSQEEFFHTFNALHNGNRQIVLTSDKPPSELKNIEDRLKSRFGWRLIADINPPDLETRIAILTKKAENEGIQLTPDVMEAIQYIAEHIESNIRDMEGALTRLISHSMVENTPITRSYAIPVLRDIISDNKLIVSPYQIKQAVADRFNVTIEEMESKKRTGNIVYPRRIAMYLCRELASLPYKKIGEELGGKDHSTVITACNTIEADLKVNANLNEIIKEIIDTLK